MSQSGRILLQNLSPLSPLSPLSVLSVLYTVSILCVMVKPSCNSEVYSNFKVKESFCKEHKIFHRFSRLPLNDWINFEKLIENDPHSSSELVSMSKYNSYYNIVAQKLIKHPFVQQHAREVKSFF